jgi:DNA polymerase III alpha subunit
MTNSATQSSNQPTIQDQISLNKIMKSILKDRVLWYDGEITFTSDQLLDFIVGGGVIEDKIHIAALDEEVIKFKKLHPSVKLNVKRELDHVDQTWNIPDSYKDININKYVQARFVDLINKREETGKDFSENEVMERLNRIETELELYKEYDMDIIIKAIIYIIDVFKNNGVVWGTGRGSSCSSYILYLIGLHSVDSVKYELDLNEFFK